ncbi:hypothetical protein SAMN05216436_11457 [bacterium A37T11]|nr:hypothetical protein SAMN05216436_11457 [bacterium A37T11]
MGDSINAYKRDMGKKCRRLGRLPESREGIPILFHNYCERPGHECAIRYGCIILTFILIISARSPVFSHNQN